MEALQAGTDLGWTGSACVEAITDQHGQAVSSSTQQLDGFGMCQAQQALLVHLQQPLPHAQAPVTACCPRGAYLYSKAR